ncbi:MAG: Ig-like domain-containing protein [Bacteroidaceae bacterium]|nr:Ig-like domain-containing protein [Bacteroidaceae bacterium]
MRNKLLMTVVLATVLASCAKDSELVDNSINPTKTNTEAVVTKQPVQFGAYVNRAVTRAGDPGTLVTSGATAGQISLQDKGFGVIAYYTDDDLYSPIYQPNFMYNTQVSYNTTANAWTYEPVQYWPNETGTNAVSEGVDRLSFFAYAPYVDVTNNTGIVTGDATTGIVGLSRNGATGDPLVKYYADLDPAKQVDFCWGTPQIDLTKQAVDDKVSFVFNHALAALNVQVDAAVDDLTPGIKLGTYPDKSTLEPNAPQTHIYVRSITFEGFVTKGAFNLNTSKATWYDLAGANYIDGGSVTVYDGRTNGREGQSDSVNEAPQGLNPLIVQDVPYNDAALQAGVTKAPVNLFNGSVDAPIYVIPSGQPLKVTIVYDVETATDELAGYLSDGVTHGTSVENKITKTISFGTSNKLEAGKKYNLTLHLGMTSVKFDATVTEWGTGETVETDLPKNSMVWGINLDPVSATIATNHTRQLNLAVTPEGVTYTAEWTSSNPDVASVDENGLVTAHSAGTATVTVKVEDKTRTCAVTVIDESRTLAWIKANMYTIDRSAYEGKVYVKKNGFITDNGNEDDVVGILTMIRPVTAVDKGLDGNATSDNGKHILVLSIKDVDGTYKWSATTGTQSGLTHALDWNTDDYYGLCVTNQMKDDPSTYPAGAAAWGFTSDGCTTGYGLLDEFRDTSDAESGKWFLPNRQQMRYMGFAGANLAGKSQAVNKLEDDGFLTHDRHYWSSTENEDVNEDPHNFKAIAFYWLTVANSWVVNSLGESKTNDYYVRPAFVY